MIRFKETGKRKWDILEVESSTNDEKIVTSMELIFSPITNKFDRLTEFTESCSDNIGKDFDDWFLKLIDDYQKSNYDYTVIKDSIPDIKKFADKNLEIIGVNFEDYIDRSKISKNSIFFDADEIHKMISASNYLKLYFVLCQDVNMKLSNKFHKEAYNILINDINNSIIYKLFQIVSSKTYEYNYTDQYMWDYIKTIYCKTTEMHVFSIFNFLMNNILTTCKTESNPIPYLINVIDESIKWILRNIYKDTIIYSEAVATQDVYSVSGKDNILSYAHNDTIGKLLVSAYNQLEHVGIERIEPFKNTLNGLKEISLFSNYITYPILSKVLNIPYRHFLTLSVSNSYLLNILLYNILPDSFAESYPILHKMLLHYNTEKPILKTTYKLKNVDEFIETLGTFLSFKNNIVPYDYYSNVIGKLSRNTYHSFLNDKEIVNFPLAKLETDIIHLYNDYFDDSRMVDLYARLEERIDMLL